MVMMQYGTVNKAATMIFSSLLTPQKVDWLADM